MGDINGDGVLNNADGYAFFNCLIKSPDCPVNQALALDIFDFNNDGEIDGDDYISFKANGYLGPEVIPATSSWGLTVLALATLIVGTLRLRRPSPA